MAHTEPTWHLVPSPRIPLVPSPRIPLGFLELALESPDRDLSYSAMKGVLQTKPPSKVADVLFDRLLLLVTDPEFSRGFESLNHLAAYPELGGKHLQMLKEMKSVADSRVDEHWRYSARSRTLQKIIEQVDPTELPGH